LSKFVDVILSLPLNRRFTYSLPLDSANMIRRGCRVVVPFGRTKSYTAIVARVHENEPKEYTVKQVTAILDETPILLPRQLDFWYWIADYYLCMEGDVFKAAFPSGLKVESETIVELNESYQPADDSLSEAERKILGLLGDVKQPIIEQVIRHDYEGMVNVQMEERSLFRYPPFSLQIR
jgi:primosomal protein N' (replication factor Y) (superfamily II helicase)